jgi:hypothetical protein
VDLARGSRLLVPEGPRPALARDRGGLCLSDVDVVVDEDEFRAAGTAQQKKLREHAARLRREPFFGDRIQRRLVPKRLRDLPNLFRLELPGAWRALYTVASHPTGGTQVRIVWIGDHKRYEELFGYS